MRHFAGVVSLRGCALSLPERGGRPTGRERACAREREIMRGREKDRERETERVNVKRDLHMWKETCERKRAHARERVCVHVGLKLKYTF